MPKKPTELTLAHDFAFDGDGDLDRQVAAFQAAYEAEHGQRLAMDAKRSLGPRKLRVTFRVVAKKGGR